MLLKKGTFSKKGKTMKKRIPFIFLIVLFVIVIVTAIFLGKPEDISKKDMDFEEYESDEELLFYTLEPYTFEPWEAEPEENIEGEPASEELVEHINSMGRDIVRFINQEYDLDWQYEDIEVITVEADESFGGWYLHTHKKMVINTNFLAGNVNEQRRIIAKDYTIIHELIHAIIDQNRGTPFFYKRYSDNEVIGGYLHEGITELLTEDYSSSIGIDIRDAYPNGLASSYVFLVYYLRATEVAFEGSIKNILNDEMYKLEEQMEWKTEDEAFDKWIFMFDITQMSYLNCLNGDYSLQPFVLAEAMTEFLITVTDDQDVLLDEINIFFNRVFGSNDETHYCDNLIDALSIMIDLSEQELGS